MGLPAVWVGAAIMATIVVDAFTDPLIGMFSDRLRSPLGRRHTLMYLAAVPAALGFYLMWHAPSGLEPEWLLAFMIVMLIFVNISISLYEIPSLALAPELAPDYNQRSKLIAFRWFFLMFGTAAMNFVLNSVYLRQDESNPLGALNQARYEDYGLTSAVIICLAIFLSTAATHGFIKRLHTPPVKAFSVRYEWAQIKAALTHKPLLMIMFGGLMMGFGAGTGQGLLYYLYLHLWGLKPQDIAWFMAAYLIGSTVALWSGPFLSGRFGKKRAIIGLYLLWLITATGPLSLKLLGLMPDASTGILLPILITNITFGIAFAVSCHIILGSSIADSIDDIAVKTGVRSEGLMFATYSVLDKIANGGGTFVAGIVITMVAFPVQAIPGTVDPQILINMAITLLVIVVFFNICSIAFLSQYSLTREDHERNAAVLAERKVQEFASAGTAFGEDDVLAPSVAKAPG